MLERRAGRVLLLADDSVLLIKGFDPARPSAGTWWLTPGGGADDGESIEATAVREVYEETGLVIEPDALGPVVATRVADFEFERRQFRQSEWFYAVSIPVFTPTTHGWEEVERRSLLDYRWWTVDDLLATDETVYPSELAEVLRAVLEGRVAQPMVLSGT